MTPKLLAAGLLLAGSTFLAGALTAHADPLIPLTPAEVAFLDHLHRVLPGSGDPTAFNSDGEQLDRARYACYQREVNGLVGFEATYVSAIVAQLAFIYLCPR